MKAFDILSGLLCMRQLYQVSPFASIGPRRAMAKPFTISIQLLNDYRDPFVEATRISASFLPLWRP